MGSALCQVLSWTYLAHHELESNSNIYDYHYYYECC